MVHGVQVERATVRTTWTPGAASARLCLGRSMADGKPPALEPKRVMPWSAERVFAVQAAMMVDLGAGSGMRQGEILGIAPDAIDFESDTLHVVQQLKLSRSKPVFALPKGGKTRDVLIFMAPRGNHVWRTSPNEEAWKPALVAAAVSEYLGHSNAALTLRIYAHLMPSSQERTRTAIATVYATARRTV